jgi:hypothetical protein
VPYEPEILREWRKSGAIKIEMGEILAYVDALRALSLREKREGTTDAEMCLRKILLRIKSGKPLDDMLPAIERFAFRNASPLREKQEGWVPGGWRYRHRITGIVTLTEQPPDRVSDLTDYEVTALWARDPALAAAPREEEQR